MITSSATDAAWMRHAVRLARGGYPAPNPRVGCVLVRDGAVVGEGFHRAAGRAHAEAMALERAGEGARGATAYVTLEPCAHFGRTPPCSDALIAAGVTRVVFAVGDPNPVAEGGAARLRAAVVEVLAGVEAEAARRVNRVWLTAMERGRPFVVVKAAMTLDGFVARADGTSQWITGERARAAGHRLRAEMGAVLVGRGTDEADQPELTARVPGVLRPVDRFVWGSGAVREGFRAVRGGSASEVLAALWAEGVTSVLVEGGARTVRSFLEEGLVDELRLFVGAKGFGAGLGWAAGLGEAQWPSLELRTVRRHGPDAELIFAGP